MSFFSIFLIGLSLSLDAFAVSVTAGVSHKRMRLLIAFKIALVFALFQVLMPAAGWLAGQGMHALLSRADHWVAFILLSLIGGKMVFEAIKPERDETSRTNILHDKILLALAIATSIDALVMGLSFSLLNVSLGQVLPTIGIVTFAMCFLGVCLGKRCGHIFENKFEILGGLVLVGLAIKILVSHLFLI